MTRARRLIVIGHGHSAGLLAILRAGGQEPPLFAPRDLR